MRLGNIEAREGEGRKARECRLTWYSIDQVQAEDNDIAHCAFAERELGGRVALYLLEC